MTARRFTAIITLLCCALGVSAKALAGDWIYKAVKGDTLWDLCITYSNKRGCWIELGKYNRIVNDRRITPGTEIRFPQSWLRETPVVGEVSSVQGEVFYYAQSGAAKSTLAAGQSLLLGSRIVTGNGSAKIQLGRHGTLLLRPESELELDSLSTGAQPEQSSELTLDRGEAELEVEPRSRFEVKTPSAIAAVRGTRYRVALPVSDKASTRGEVLDGTVEVQAGSKVQVPAGFGVLAQKGKPVGEPRKLLPPPVFDQARVEAPLPLSVQWQPDPNAVAWRLDLLSADTRAELLASHRLGEAEIAFTDLPEACYQLVLRAIDAEGFNGLESRLPVCVVARLGAPTGIAVEKSADAGTPYRLAWTPLAGARQYRVEVAADADFTQIVSSQELKANQLGIAPGDVPVFHARVTAIDEHGNAGQASAAVEYHTNRYLTRILLSWGLLGIALL